MAKETGIPPESRVDHAEFVRLLKRHERRLNGYVLALVQNWNDADDILQAVAVRLWEQFDEYRPDGDFGAWACKIAYYEVLTYRKRKGRRALQTTPAFDQAVLEDMAAAENNGPGPEKARRRVARAKTPQEPV